jgi:hypothetical protein
MFADEFMKAMEDESRKQLRDVLTRYERIVQESFTEEKHGNEYVRGGKVHVASAPGEAPAIDTGRLRQSIRWMIEKMSATAWKGTIGTTMRAAKYPAALEFGSSGMEARPAWRLAFEKLVKEINTKR